MHVQVEILIELQYSDGIEQYNAVVFKSAAGVEKIVESELQ